MTRNTGRAQCAHTADPRNKAAEFRRDRAAGHAVGPPSGYFPDGDPDRSPVDTWRPHGLGLFGNWLAGIERRAGRERPRDRLAA